MDFFCLGQLVSSISDRSLDKSPWLIIIFSGKSKGQEAPHVPPGFILEYSFPSSRDASPSWGSLRTQTCFRLSRVSKIGLRSQANRGVILSNKIHRYPFIRLCGERHCESKVCCLKHTTQCPRPGLEPGPPDPGLQRTKHGATASPQC